MFNIFFFLMIRRPPRSTPFPTRRSSDLDTWDRRGEYLPPHDLPLRRPERVGALADRVGDRADRLPRRDDHGRKHEERSEEHTSELQSRQYLVCRLLLEKKKTSKNANK